MPELPLQALAEREEVRVRENIGKIFPLAKRVRK
jgi:hypothetical protein